MRMQENDAEEIKNLLQKNWRAGNRWIAYEDKADVSATGMVGFPNVTLANVYCDNRNTDEHLIKFKAITSVLKSIFSFEGLLREHLPSLKRLENEIKRHSIMPVSMSDDLIKSLQTGEIYPVIIQKKIEPQTEIGRYHIMEQHEGPERVVGKPDQQPSTIATYDNYKQASEHFQKIYVTHEASSYSRKPSVFFVGEFKGHRLQMGNEGFPEKNTGLLIAMSRSLFELDRPYPYRHIPVHEHNQPAYIHEPVVARFNPQTDKITLMDGHLKPIVPGKVTHYMEIEHFGFKSPIKIEPGQLQTVRQLQEKELGIGQSWRNRPV